MTNWLLAAEGDLSHPRARAQYDMLIRHVRGARKQLAAVDKSATALYDTRKAGADSKEVRALITGVLPSLATAYQLAGDKTQNPYYQDPAVLAEIMTAFDRLHQRGFRQPMQMPWKLYQIDDSKKDQAVIMDFHLRVAGYAVATFLMREELKAAGKFERTLATCAEYYSHPEKTGDLRGEKLGADGIRLALQFGLPYFLAQGLDSDLDLLKRQLDRSMALDYDCSDTIKPDGLVYHHRGAYVTGYGAYAVAQATQMAWLLRDTRWAAAPETVDNLRNALLTIRTLSNKYDVHPTLAGRLREIDGISHNLLGYAWMADLDGGERPQMYGVLARLADDRFWKTPERSRSVFRSHRNEAIPGPGAVAAFQRILARANEQGAESAPVGNWAYNYGPMSVHRRDNWMVAVKGCSKYLWAFERSVLDARKDARLENVFGFNDSACAIRMYGSGDPVNAADSGYSKAGWDWSRIPGATTRLIPPEKLAELDILGEKFNRPYAISSFCGGVSLNGHGLFAQAYSEVGFDQHNTTPGFGSAHDPRKKPKRPLLRAEKSVFFFGDQIFCLTSGVRNGDGVHPVGTTLFQTAADESFSSKLAANTLRDAAGNGYYVPNPKSLNMRTAKQTAAGRDGVTQASGHFATAWFDHGVSPTGDSCMFVILPQASDAQVAEFADSASDIFAILQQDDQAHILKHQRLGMTGVAVFSAGDVRHGPLLFADRSLLMMIEERGRTLRVSVCDPDLRWQPGVHYRHKKNESGAAPKTESSAVSITLKLRGAWQAASPSPGVATSPETSNTIIAVSAAAGEPVTFELRGGEQ